VEDDPVDRKQMERLLVDPSLSDYELVFADRLAQALALLAEREFEIVLLDLNLPDSAGLETLCALEKKHPDLPKVVVAGGDDEPLGLEAVARGAQDYLIKEKFNARALARVIHYSVERKRSAQMLRESRGKLNAILESLHDPLLMLDKDLGITWSNGASRKVFGDAREGCKCFQLFQRRETPCDPGACIVREAFADGKPHSYDVQVVDTEGQTRYFHCTATAALHDAEGHPTAVIAIARDITDSKAVEIVKMAYARVEKADRELREIQQQLAQSAKLASIGQIAAGVTHEMNTPVGFVASNFRTLETYVERIRSLLQAYDGLVGKIGTDDTGELRQAVQSIQELRAGMRLDFILKDLASLFEDSREGLQRITDILQNLRDFARADRTGALSAYDINDGLQATLTVARNELRYDVQVHTEFGDVPQVLCNPGQINQVFLNLLINAAQAIQSQTRPGKGSITIRTYPTAAHVVCEIEDDGPGIAAAHLPRIFDPFFTTKPPGKGTGLGLSVSYDIVVNKHHGQISVESKENRGAKFIVRLPLTPAARAGQDAQEVLTGVESDG